MVVALVVGLVCIVWGAAVASALDALARRRWPLLWSPALAVISVVPGIAVALMMRSESVAQWDRLGLEWAISHRSESVLGWADDVTEIGSISGTGFLALILGLIFAYLYRSVIPFLLLPGGWFLVLRIQRAIDAWDERAQPLNADAIGDVGGFPSGGVLRIVYVLGVLGLILATLWRTRRERIILGCVVGSFVGAECATRLLLGRHWPADVIAGVAIGTLLLGAAAPLVQRLPRPRCVPNISSTHRENSFKVSPGIEELPDSCGPTAKASSK